MSMNNSYENAEILYEQEDFLQALHMFENLEDFQTNADIQNYIGCCLLNLERYSEAISIFKKLISQYPEWGRPVYNLGRVYLKQGDCRRAFAFFQKAVQINSHDADAYYYLGVYYERMEDFHRAVSCYQKAIAIAPDEFEPHMGLANCYDRMHNQQQALSESRTAFQLFDCPDTLYNYTRCLVLSKEYKTAFDLLQQHDVADCDDEGLLMNLFYTAKKIEAHDVCLKCAKKIPENQLSKFIIE